MPTFTLPNGLLIDHVNPVESLFVYREIFEERCYLRHGIRITPGDVILDVGANIGLFALFAQQVAPGVTVHAVEPVPSVHALLQRNLARHHVAGSAVRCAAGAHDGRATFRAYPNNTIMSGIHADPAADKESTRAFLLRHRPDLAPYLDMFLAGAFQVEEVDVELKTVSTIARELSLPSISLLKIDVERAELDVLKGIEASDWPRIAQVVAEVHDENGALAKVRDLLEAQGFTVAVETDPAFEGTSNRSVYAWREG